MAVRRESTEKTEITEQTEVGRETPQSFPFVPLFPSFPYSLFVSPRGKLLIESVSKDELIKFIEQVRINDLINHILLPEHKNLSEINEAIADARKAVKQFLGKHHALIEQTPLVEIRGPLMELLSNPDRGRRN